MRILPRFMKSNFCVIALFTSLSAVVYADPIPTNCSPVLSGLVSWWMGSDNANDSVGANHGTLVGGTTFAPGKYGQAFSLDGVDDGVNVADSPSLQLTQSFTIEAWVYIRAYPVEPQSFWTIGSIVFRGDDRGGLDPYSLIVRGATQKLEFSIQSADNQPASIEAPVTAGEWVHVVAVLDDATSAMKLYVNGSLAAATNTPVRPLGPLDPASNPGLGIGNVQGAGRSPFRFPFNGLLDNVRIYNRALSQSEIQSIYAPTAGCELPLGLRIYAGLTFSAPVGGVVRIEYRNTVGASNDWRFLTNVLVPTTPYTFLDPASSTIPQRFYRAFVLP
jgi:hypothetical protein